MKHLVLMLLIAQPVITHAGSLSNFIEFGGKTAAVVYNIKNCLASDSSCFTPEGNTLDAPKVLIYNKTGNLEKSIPFFDNQCGYDPVKLSREGQKLTLTVQIVNNTISIQSDEESSSLYPDCQYTDGTIVKETRNLKTGNLANRVIFQDYRTATIP
jgi:hypothetical protein